MNILDMYAGIESALSGQPGEPNGDAQVAEIEVALEENRADLAEAIVEVQELGAEVEALAEELEEHEEAHEELAEEVAGLESMLGSGQYSSNGFARGYARAQRLNAKLGGRNFNTLGAESISDASSARMASVTGVEGFMDTLKGGASKAIEYIRHIFNTVINFFVGMFSTAAGLEKRAKSIKARLGRETKLKEKVKLGKWNVGLDYANKGVGGLNDLVSAGFLNVLDGPLPAFMEVGKATDGIDAGKFKTAYKSLTDSLKDMAKAVGTVTDKADKSDKRMVLGVHAGFRLMVSFEEKYDTDAEIVSAARSVKLSFGRAGETKDLVTGEVASKVTSVGALEAILKGVDDYVESIRTSKVQQKFSKAERDRIIGTLNVASKTKAEGKEGNDKAIGLVKAVFVSASALTISIEKLYAALARQRMDLVEAHY